MPQYADGGVVTEPTLAWVGEAGQPEAVLPLVRGSNGQMGVQVHAQTADREAQVALEKKIDTLISLLAKDGAVSISQRKNMVESLHGLQAEASRENRERARQ